MSPSLSESQRRMYALERTENFRWIASHLAKPSPRPLTSQNLTPLKLQDELAEIGQYTEVAHGHLSPEFIWENMEHLQQPHFPLHGYDALRGSELISSFRGKVGKLQGYIARQSKTLIVAFSGTSNFVQAVNNLDIRLIAHPAGDKCTVHGGFWRLYNGIRALALDKLVKALGQYEVEQLVFTGHSLGGAMCYLLALDALEAKRAQNASPILPLASVNLTVAVFGCPRIGNRALMQHWRSLCADRLERKFPIREYSVKGYNDGVPLLPLQFFGFHHLARTPFYFFEGCLYEIPKSESEYAHFTIEDDAVERARRCLDHPLGGHNYYSGRDMERLLRTMRLLCPRRSGEADWDGYLDSLRNHGERCTP